MVRVRVRVRVRVGGWMDDGEGTFVWLYSSRGSSPEISAPIITFFIRLY